jgi:hypothetical protein
MAGSLLLQALLALLEALLPEALLAAAGSSAAVLRQHTAVLLAAWGSARLEEAALGAALWRVRALCAALLLLCIAAAWLYTPSSAAVLRALQALVAQVEQQLAVTVQMQLWQEQQAAALAAAAQAQLLAMAQEQAEGAQRAQEQAQQQQQPLVPQSAHH